MGGAMTHQIITTVGQSFLTRANLPILHRYTPSLYIFHWFLRPSKILLGVKVHLVGKHSLSSSLVLFQRETVAANSSFSQTFAVTPLLAANRQKQGLALDGKLKHEDTNLASSTM